MQVVRLAAFGLTIQVAIIIITMDVHQINRCSRHPWFPHPNTAVKLRSLQLRARRIVATQHFKRMNAGSRASDSAGRGIFIIPHDLLQLDWRRVERDADPLSAFAHRRLDVTQAFLGVSTDTNADKPDGGSLARSSRRRSVIRENRFFASSL